MTSKISLAFFVFLVLFASVPGRPASAKTKINLKKAPQLKYHRIVSLKPNITQVLTSLGAGDQIVGITKYCERPNHKAKVVADYNNVDVEAVIRLKPDLVLTSPENSRSRQFEALKAAGLNSHLFEFDSYAKMKASVLAIAKLIGRPLVGGRVVARMDSKLVRLADKLKSQSKVPKLFIVIVQRHPLMVASGKTFISSLFEEIGLKNAFHFNKIAYPVIDEEELIREMADYTFELSHETHIQESEFLNKTVIPLKMEHFLAAPLAVDSLARLFESQKVRSGK